MEQLCLYYLTAGTVLSWICLVLLHVQVRGYSMERKIIDSAPKAEMFDLFHIMPKGELKVMTELDILLSLDQYKQLYTKPARRGKRKAVRDVAKRWTDCKVYYEITDSLNTPENRDVIIAAIKEWEKYTCLRFEENRWRHNRIQFQDGGGCYSELGMQGQPQILILARGCRTKGIITHEIGHAIGWYHEHMRPDRDEYIHINEEIIPMRYRPNFAKYENDVVNTYGVPYDYTSIMHYGNDALPGSIITLDPRYQDKIGQRQGMTFKDIKLANLMYNCAGVMQCEKKKCDHNGFVWYKDVKGVGKCECWCDSGNWDEPLVPCSSINKEPEPPIPSPLPPTETPVVRLCYDVREDCAQMKAQGMCMTKMELMMDACTKTCDFCGKGEGMCMDHEKGCAIMAASGACTDPGLESVMSTMCPASCNKCEKPPSPCDIQRELLGLPNENSGTRLAASAWMWSFCFILSVLWRLGNGWC